MILGPRVVVMVVVSSQTGQRWRRETGLLYYERMRDGLCDKWVAQ
jgi:hypothetical protein